MQQQRVDLEQLIHAYREVFEGEVGQLVLADLIRAFGYTDRTTFEKGASAADLAFKEGQRSTLMHINRRLHADAEAARALEEITTYVD